MLNPHSQDFNREGAPARAEQLGVVEMIMCVLFGLCVFVCVKCERGVFVCVAGGPNEILIKTLFGHSRKPKRLAGWQFGCGH